MITTIYFSGFVVIGSFWLFAFLCDPSTSNHHVSSWIALLIATLIWPIAFPLSYLELSKRANANAADCKSLHRPSAEAWSLIDF